ncbi:MAG: hypothetical protein HQM04_08395 [Magnetococcales bacterium]|nr:hypothetical protein [Magnetococcales bacterium]MBF0115051.1 hypothetical protein [Magnetococcales bacterium]
MRTKAFLLTIILMSGSMHAHAGAIINDLCNSIALNCQVTNNAASCEGGIVFQLNNADQVTNCPNSLAQQSDCTVQNGVTKLRFARFPASECYRGEQNGPTNQTGRRMGTDD